MTFITTPDIFSKDAEIQDVEAAQFVRLQLVPVGAGGAGNYPPGNGSSISHQTGKSREKC